MPSRRLKQLMKRTWPTALAWLKLMSGRMQLRRSLTSTNLYPLLKEDPSAREPAHITSRVMLRWTKIKSRMCMAKRQQACSRLLKLTSWQILMPRSENFYISTLLRTILGRLRCGFQVFAIYPVPVFGVAMIFLPLFFHILPQIIISVCYSGQLVTLLCRVTKVMLDQVSTITNNRSILLCVFYL